MTTISKAGLWNYKLDTFVISTQNNFDKDFLNIQQNKME